MKRQFFAFCFFLNSLISFGNASLDDQQNEHDYITKLNFDCQEKILNYLENEELMPLMRVSLWWKERLLQHPEFREFIIKAESTRSILRNFYPVESAQKLMIVYDRDLGILDSIKTEIATLCSGNHLELRFFDFWKQPLDLDILEKIIYKYYRETPEENLYAMTRRYSYAPLVEMSAREVPGNYRPSVFWLRKELPKGKFFISTKKNIPLLQEHLKSDNSWFVLGTWERLC